MRLLRAANWVCLCALLWLPTSAFAQAGGDYDAQIRQFTTEPRFLSDLVDHLPVSDSVPSPLDHFGQIVGAPDRLHHVNEIYGYMRALDEASDRVQIRSIGQTEEDREMIEVIVADEATIRDLEKYRNYLNRLADPRGLSTAEKAEMVRLGKPVYYVTGGLHSPETGSPEMLMELAYRLAVEDSDLIRNIRENVITVIVPVAEPDGRDRMVDVYNYRKAHNDVGPPLVYWGHYVAHDNNRDGFGLALALTRNILKGFLYWKPTVGHDLHESVPYLYISTGTGPYNENIDAITVNEWHNLAHEEVSALTSFGMPGVWTHGFYTGWAGNYLLWIANNRNSIGRFYETFGNSIPETKERKLPRRSTSREWYRTNPPLEKALWSFRNNINYQQTALLTALNYVARNRARFLDDFWKKSSSAVQKGREEAPHAFVFPVQQKRPLATIELVNLLREQGLEVHRLRESFTPTTKADAKDDKNAENGEEKESATAAAEPASDEGEATKEQARTLEAGSYVVRLDQPYRALARILLGVQHFPEGDQPPYDDTGWTLPYLRGVDAVEINDPAVLEASMEPVTEGLQPEPSTDAAEGEAYLVNQTTDDAVSLLRFRLDDVKFLAAEKPFDFGGKSYNSGSFIIPTAGNASEFRQKIEKAAREAGVSVETASQMPEVPTHEVGVPRVALVHTWVVTPQNAGWWRLSFDRLGVPYSYLSEQDLAVENLSRFDVIILPNSWADTKLLIAGTTDVGDPIPWRHSDEYPSLGVIDETDDVRKGMGYDGLEKLADFVHQGGVLIVEGNTCNFAIDTALTQRVRIQRTRELLARGSVLKTGVTDAESPIVYGYSGDVAVHFSQSPVFDVDKSVGGFATPDWAKDATWKDEVPRPVLSFAKKDILMSGMLRGGGELAGKPAVVDVPVGEGHVVMFAIHPFWRWETHGSHALVFNTMLHWNHLRAGWPARPAEDEADEDED